MKFAPLSPGTYFFKEDGQYILVIDGARHGIASTRAEAVKWFKEQSKEHKT